MGKLLFKYWVLSFVITTVVALFFGIPGYQSTQGFEARQGTFMGLIVVVVMCLVCGILSLAIFANVIKQVRQNLFASAFAFIGLPALLFFFVAGLYFKSGSSNNGFMGFLSAAVPLLYTVVLGYYFSQFRKQISSV